MPSNKQARRKRQAARQATLRPASGQDRIKLPGGGAVLVPDRDHPAWDAIDRLRAGTGTEQDLNLVAEWLPTTDIRYWQHMMRVAKAPRRAEDVLVSRGHVTPTSDAVKKIKAKLADLITDGELGMCTHVRHLAPDAATWAAWAPQKLRCQACLDEYDRTTVTGTREDFRCDACGHIGKRIVKLAQMTEPFRYMEVIVPILIIFGLCVRCAGPAGAATENTSTPGG